MSQDKPFTLHDAENIEMAQQFIESVKPDKLREVMLSVDQNQCTALHIAAAFGRNDVVEYLCNMAGADLILKTEKLGQTALHNAANVKIACQLVKYMPAEKQKEFVLHTDQNQHTALHTAARTGRNDVVEYLCDIPFPEDELVLMKDKLGGTALRLAESKEIAQLLIDAVEPRTRREFILAVDQSKNTVLHSAANQGKTDVVEYLCSLQLLGKELILKKNKMGQLALHYARSKEIAQLLVESVEPDKQTVFIQTADVNQSTPLHIAANQGRTEVVEYLCRMPRLGSELILMRNKEGRTALHFTRIKEIAQLLVESVDCEKKKAFIATVDVNQCTALHLAANQGRTGLVEYLCSMSLPCSELILKKDRLGSTALHHAKNKEIAQLLITSIEPGIVTDFILGIDDNQRTALHTASQFGRADVIEYLLSFSDSKWVLWKDHVGGTALRFAKSKQIAQLLVESVEPDKRKELLLAADCNQHTVLHAAAVQGKADMVEYLCSIHLPDNELVQKKDKWNRTALHYAASEQIAKLLVESIETDKQCEFMLAAGDNRHTALHAAASNGKTDVVKYFCGKPFPGSELIMEKDEQGRTALHHAKNSDIVRILLESVEPDRKRELLLTTDEDQCTALHTAAQNATNVVKYLCEISLPDDELLLQRDKRGRTALYNAKNKGIAENIIESANIDKQEELLLSSDQKGCTGLHIAVAEGRTDVVEYLCSLPLVTSEVILVQDEIGATALRYAKDKQIARLLVESVDSGKQRDLLMATEETGCTVLHIAATGGRTDVVEYLCSMPLPDSELLRAKCSKGETPLHCAASGKIVGIILDSLETEVIEELLATEDIYGNTVVLSLVRQGRVNSLTHLLEYIEQSDDLDVLLTDMLQHTNKCKQNILHLIVLSLAMEDLYEVLLDYTSYLDTDMKGLIVPDIYNNTPLHYVTARYGTKLLAEFILQLPLARRNHIARSKNQRSINCVRIARQKNFSQSFYIQNVLCDTENQSYSAKFAEHGFFPSPDFSDQLENPEQYYRYDEDILKVLKYALNEYSLLDSAYTMSHTLFSSAVLRLQERFSGRRMEVVATKCEPPKHLAISTEKVERASDCLCLFIRCEEVDDPKQHNVQRILNKMDTETYHGRPKIAIVEAQSTEDLNLIVPGPDYLILTVKHAASAYVSRQTPDVNKYVSTDDLINELRCKPGVKKICVNSSLNKRYLRNEIELDPELDNIACGLNQLELSTPHKLVFDGTKRGKALIICNQHEVQQWMDEREKRTVPLRKEVLKKARLVFGELLGLDVRVEYDLTGDEMKRSIVEFSQQDDHGCVVALAIFSHGFERKISGSDSNSECSVQEVIDSLYLGNIDSLPKLLFLSFCRGDLPPRYNRAPFDFESSPQFPWPESEVGMRFQPVRQQLPPETKEQEWRNLFPSLEIPVDCYVCFTTLPDSKSRPGEFFTVLLDHLLELSKNTEQISSDVKVLVDQEADSTGAATTLEPMSKIELVALLTDVAGILKEKSRSTQYVNLCYTINRQLNAIKVYTNYWTCERRFLIANSCRIIHF